MKRMNKIIERTYLNNSTTIKFKYIGVYEDATNDIIKIENKLDRVFNNYYQTSMESIIRDIRTILEKCNEDYLEVSFQNNYTDSKIIYLNMELQYYREEKYVENKNKVVFCYEKDSNLDFQIHGLSSVNYNNEKIVSLFEKFIKKQKQLQNISGIKLNYNDELLFKVYKLFYNENPDFCEGNINIKIQTMIAVLAQFNICLNYPLIVNSFDKMPQNFNLKYMIENLRALEKLDVNKLNSTKLTYSYEKEIKEIGKLIRESCINMTMLSKIVHAENYSLSDKSDVGQLIQFTKCNEEEIIKGIQLVKRINNVIE